MGIMRAAYGSSEANKALFVGATPNLSTGTTHGRRMYLHEIKVTPRGANWAADVELYLYNTYTGQGSELVSNSTLAPTINTTLKYESDFTADADSWTDGGGGALTLAGNQTISTVEDCLKVTADAGGDPFQLDRATTRVAATHYKLTFDYFAETGGNIAYLGLGTNGANTTQAYDHGSGGNLAVTENAWQESQVLWCGTGAGTTLKLCGFTAQNGSTRDNLDASKYIAFKNMELASITNQAAWTAGATGWAWDYANERASKIVNGTTDFEQTIATAPVADEVYRLSYVHTRSATGVTPAYAGTTLAADPAAGTLVEDFFATDTTADLTFTADATLVGTLDTISLKKYGGISKDTYFLKDSIRSGTTAPYVRTFHNKQPYCTGGNAWALYATTGGSSCVMDATMIYELV